jgi:hypothetical protein
MAVIMVMMATVIMAIVVVISNGENDIGNAAGKNRCTELRPDESKHFKI